MQRMDEAIAYSVGIIPWKQNKNSWLLEVCSRIVPPGNIEKWDSHGGGQEYLMFE